MVPPRSPNFLVIGAMKAGTTSLYEYLKAHPDVFMPDKKELDFFVEETTARKRSRYEEQFAGAADAVAVGEASTSYSKWPVFPGTAERIAAWSATMRLIYVIRDPIERIKSHYVHDVLLGLEKLPFEDALRRNPIYLDVSNYSMQLAQYLDHFPSKQIMVVLSEQLRTNRRATMTRVHQFLGIDSAFVPANVDTEFHRSAEKRLPKSFAGRIVGTNAYGRVNQLVPRPIKRLARTHLVVQPPAPRVELTESFRRELVARLALDVTALRRFLGDGFDGWGLAP